MADKNAQLPGKPSATAIAPLQDDGSDSRMPALFFAALGALWMFAFIADHYLPVSERAVEMATLLPLFALSVFTLVYER